MSLDVVCIVLRIQIYHIHIICAYMYNSSIRKISISLIVVEYVSSIDTHDIAYDIDIQLIAKIIIEYNITHGNELLTSESNSGFSRSCDNNV